MHYLRVVVGEILASFCLVGLLTFVLGSAHRLGRLIAISVTGADRSRTREFVRFVGGAVVEVFAYASLVYFLLVREPGRTLDSTSGRVLVASLVTVAIARPMAMLLLSYTSPSAFVEGRSMRYLVSGTWYERTGEEFKVRNFPRHLRQAKDDPEAAAAVLVQYADWGERRLKRGERMSHADRERLRMAKIWQATADEDWNMVLELSDPLTSANPAKLGTVDLMSLQFRALALLATSRFSEANGTAVALLDLLPDPPDPIDEARAEIWNLAAYTFALLGEELERAEQLVRASLEERHDIARKGTLGGVLVQVGGEAEGVNILREVLRADLKPKDQHETLLFLAHGLAELGMPEEAADQRQRAAALADEHDLHVPPFAAETIRSPSPFGDAS